MNGRQHSASPSLSLLVSKMRSTVVSSSRSCKDPRDDVLAGEWRVWLVMVLSTCSRNPQSGASRLSPILRSFPRVTGLSGSRSRGRIRTNTGEKMPLTEAHAPWLCLPPPPTVCGLQGVPEYAPGLWPQSSYAVSATSLWVHGGEAPSIPGPAALAPSLWQPCVWGVGMST